MQRSIALSRIFQASCILLFWAVAHSSFAALIGNLTVNNATANGGSGTTYQVCPGGNSCGTTSGFASNALQYVDRAFIINSSVPAALDGETFILTANSDKNTAAGSSSYMSFTLGAAATVYVAYCTAITNKPAWLTANFTDTRTSVTNSSSFTFQIYSKTYSAGSTVTLGSNVATGGGGSIGMYSVIVVPTATPPISWGYYNGTYNWYTDYSSPGGVQGVVINYNDTTGGPLSGTQDISVSANGNLWEIWAPVMAQSFSYPIPGYSKLTISIKPTRANWSGQIYFMGVGDVLLGPNGTMCALPSTEFSNYLVAGSGPSLAPGLWSTYNFPLSILCVPPGGPVYKFGLQDQTGDMTNVWYVDNVGFAP